MAPGFRHEIEIATPLSRLHAFLCDLHHHAPLHPLIVRVEDLPTDPSAPGARRYRVLDRVPVGPFRVKARYVASLEPVGAHEVLGRAWQSPGIHLRTTWTLDARGPTTGLVESVEVAAPRLLRGFVTRQARASHWQTLERMKALLEGEARAPG